MVETTPTALLHEWRRAATIVCFLLTIAPNAFAVDNLQAADGLKEALTNGTASAVGLLGRPGGYFNDAAVKILLPNSLKPLATGLRAMGLGPQIDKFVLSILDGLFYMVGQEERKIRTNPAAQVTPLLREVFGSH
jgi:hypothetical protein